MTTNTKGRAASLSHTQIILRELVEHGRVTYADLCRRYPSYSYATFVQSARDLERAGAIRRPERAGGAIEIAGACPCCGREL